MLREISYDIHIYIRRKCNWKESWKNSNKSSLSHARQYPRNSQGCKKQSCKNSLPSRITVIKPSRFHATTRTTPVLDKPFLRGKKIVFAPFLSVPSVRDAAPDRRARARKNDGNNRGRVCKRGMYATAGEKCAKQDWHRYAAAVYKRESERGGGGMRERFALSDILR